DGGGVRSYSSVLIIQELINEIARYEDIFEKEFTFYPRKFDPRSLRPCHYFDKMYGTSTGGILAIALSRLRMTVPETIGAFRRLVTAMFTNSRSAIPLATKYNHRPFENTLEEMVQFYCKQHRSGTCNRTEQFPWESAEDHDTDPLCQTFACRGRYDLHTLSMMLTSCRICLTSDAPATGISEAYLLRTYDHTYFQAPSWVTQYNSGVADMSIGQVARATTATPFYFKPVQAFIGDPPVLTTLKDGGIRENNPSACAWMENASFHGNDARPSVLLSIGAGKFKPQSEGGSSSRTQQYAKRFAGFISVFLQAVEGEERHKVMRTLAGGDHTWYKRLNVTTGLENIKLDTWESGLWEPLGSDGRSKNYRGGKTMNRIQIATEAYLNDDAHLNEDAIGEISPREMLKQTAEKLVRSRRAREFEAMTEGGEKRERWETYMGKHLAGERDFFQEYLAQWDYALLGRKEQHD
ncbi:FabD/lysophospholipase-like protein, partial [Lophium mytilinum]